MAKHGFSKSQKPKHLIILIIAFIVVNCFAVFGKSTFDLIKYSPNKKRRDIALSSSKNHKLGVFHNLSALYNLTTALPVSKNSALPTFEIFLPEARIAMLNSDLPESGDVYQPARIRMGDEAYRVNVKYRGDNSYHWGGDFKSWGVKFSRNDRFFGFRYLHLINPRSITGLEMMGGNYLGKQLGSLIPPASLARLFVNGKYQGVVQAVFRPSEAVVRSNKVMPGDLFDFEPKGHWNDVSRWRKRAHSNYFEEDSRVNFGNFLDIMHTINHSDYSPANYDKFKTIANIDKMIDRWIVQNQAGSMHQDRSHNQIWYVDPLTGKSEPVVWDVWGHGQYWGLKDDLQSPLVVPHLTLLRYGNLISKKNVKLYKVTEEDVKTGAQKEFFKSLWEKAEYDFASSKMIDMGYMTTKPFRPLYWPRHDIKKEYNDILKFVDWRNKVILDAASHNRVQLVNINDTNYSFRLKGQVGVHLTNIRVKSGFRGNQFDVNFKNGQKVTFQLSDAAKRLYAPKQSIKIHPSFGISYRNVWHSLFRPVQLTTEILFSSETPIEQIILKNLANRQFVGLNPIKVVENQQYVYKDKVLADLEECKIKDKPVICRWTYEESVLEIQTPEKIIEYGPGEITFKNTKYFKEHETVIFKPGTTVYLGRNASLIFKGKMFSKGTANQQIKFKSARSGSDPDDQWQVIALVGPQTNGSQIIYTQFEGGKGGVVDHVYYTGAVNIIHAENILISKSVFRKNYAPSDDILHVAKCKNITINQSAFQNGAGDGLDADISDVNLMENTFTNNTNDGLDLMESTAVAQNNLFESSGDKGISVGEASQLTAAKNKFIDSNMCIAVKDESSAYITDNDFHNCQTDIFAYKKSPYYSTGGVIFEKGNRFLKKTEDNTALIRTDDYSCHNDSCLKENHNIRKSASKMLTAIFHSMETTAL